ncbi:MAG: WD40 repeat domain-containing protein, partial [Acidimicrobiia bacterium]|nr:WD40 repeat domain-containing protein [Acidimicrobiia bacterium]
FARGRLAFGSAAGAFIVHPERREVTIVPTFGPVSSLAFARDGAVLAIGTADGSVRLWDVEREVSRGVLWRSGVGISNGAWYEEESDSIWVVVSDTQLVRLPLDPDIHLDRACEIVGRDLTQEEWDRFVPGGGPVRSTCPGNTS